MNCRLVAVYHGPGHPACAEAPVPHLSGCFLCCCCASGPAADAADLLFLLLLLQTPSNQTTHRCRLALSRDLFWISPGKIDLDLVSFFAFGFLAQVPRWHPPGPSHHCDSSPGHDTPTLSSTLCNFPPEGDDPDCSEASHTPRMVHAPEHRLKGPRKNPLYE